MIRILCRQKEFIFYYQIITYINNYRYLDIFVQAKLKVIENFFEDNAVKMVYHILHNVREQNHITFHRKWFPSNCQPTYIFYFIDWLNGLSIFGELYKFVLWRRSITLLNHMYMCSGSRLICLYHIINYFRERKKSRERKREF